MTHTDAEIKAALRFVDRMVKKADGMSSNVYPWWHGWAIREAYLAGMAAERRKAKRKTSTKRKRP